MNKELIIKTAKKLKKLHALDVDKKLSKITDIGFIILNDSDVVRHELVKKIINAYESK